MCKKVISGFFTHFFPIQIGQCPQRCSPWNVGSCQVRVRKIFGKSSPENLWMSDVRCLSMPFGVNTPQQSEEDEGVYYTEVYQSDVVLQN